MSKSGKRYWYLPLYFVPVVTLCIEVAFLPKSCVVRYNWDIKYSMPTSTHSSLEYLTCLLLLNIRVSNIRVLIKMANTEAFWDKCTYHGWLNSFPLDLSPTNKHGIPKTLNNFFSQYYHMINTRGRNSRCLTAQDRNNGDVKC